MARPAHPERNKRMLEMYNQGMKQADIAKETGLAVISVGKILRSMPEYRRRGTNKADKTLIKAENDNKEAKEELQYLDILDKFSKAVQQTNDIAKDGITVRQIRKRLQQISPYFLILIED